MNLISAIIERQERRRTQSAAGYREILERANAPRDGDADRLEELMQQMGLAPDDVSADVIAIETVKRLEAQLPPPEQIESLRSAAKLAQADHVVRFRQMLSEAIAHLDESAFGRASDFLLFNENAFGDAAVRDRWLADMKKVSERTNAADAKLQAAASNRQQLLRQMQQLRAGAPRVFDAS